MSNKRFMTNRKKSIFTKTFYKYIENIEPLEISEFDRIFDLLIPHALFKSLFPDKEKRNVGKIKNFFQHFEYYHDKFSNQEFINELKSPYDLNRDKKCTYHFHDDCCYIIKSYDTVEIDERFLNQEKYNQECGHFMNFRDLQKWLETIYQEVKDGSCDFIFTEEELNTLKKEELSIKAIWFSVEQYMNIAPSFSKGVTVNDLKKHIRLKVSGNNNSGIALINALPIPSIYDEIKKLVEVFLLIETNGEGVKQKIKDIQKDLKFLFVEYYRLKFSPDIKAFDYLLEKLKFYPCINCSKDEYKKYIDEDFI